MLAFVLMLIAVILFILAAVPVSAKYNLMALGLAFMAGSFLLGLYPG